MIALSLILFSGMLGGANAAPQIERLNPLRTPFGTIFQGDTLHFEFHFQNRGDAPLIIHEVKTECGCTLAHLSAERLVPGATGSVAIRYDSSKDRGLVGHRIKLLTNDPRRPVEEFHIAGVVIVPVEYEPPLMDFARVWIGETRERTISLINNTNQPISIKTLSAVDSLKNVRFELPANEIPPESQVNLRGICEAKTVERINTRIRIEFDPPTYPALEIPVVGFVPKPKNK